MKAVILAAGKSTRTYPVTVELPKPLVKVAGKTIIEHNLEQISEYIDEAILIVGFKSEIIKKHLGKKFGKIKITYIEQKEQLGTGHALMCAEKKLSKERFIVMMGDDMYNCDDAKMCLRYPLSVMAKKVKNYKDYGVFVKKDDKILDIVEKPKEYISDLVNCAFYVFDENVFECLHNMKKSERGEYELTEALKMLAIKKDIFCVESKHWIPVTYPWSILNADNIARKGNNIIGKGTKINGRVVDSTIGDNCRIDGNVKNCLILDNVKISAGSTVENSIICDNVIFSGSIKSAKKNDVEIKGKKMSVENFGAAIGKYCVLENVKIMPGTLIYPNIKKKNCTLKGIIGNNLK